MRPIARILMKLSRILKAASKALAHTSLRMEMRVICRELEKAHAQLNGSGMLDADNWEEDTLPGVDR